ncbi:MAG: BlaI/MecI/CopY family transcriptional regulator [Clostridiales bacterium]|nr:BlaI/MecI/CopY family transcriptional regulator [Clostridiales bacterium]
MTITKLPDVELQVMEAIWALETPASTAAVKARLEESRPWNLSALQTILGRLVKKGFLATSKEGKNRYYSWLISEDEYMAEESRIYMQKLKGSSIRDIVACLYDSNSLTDEDLAELKEFIDQKTGGI